MIREDSTETYTSPYVKQIASAKFNARSRASKAHARRQPGDEAEGDGERDTGAPMANPC